MNNALNIGHSCFQYGNDLLPNLGLHDSSLFISDHFLLIPGQIQYMLRCCWYVICDWGDLLRIFHIRKIRPYKLIMFFGYGRAGDNIRFCAILGSIGFDQKEQGHESFVKTAFVRKVSS